MNNQPQVEPTVRTVIFDLGGVILRTDNHEPRRLLAEKMGLAYEDLDKIVFGNPVAQLAERGQATVSQVWAEIGKILQIPANQVDQFRREFFAGDIIDPGLLELIDRIHRRYKTALLSNTWITDLESFARQNLQIPGIFDLYIDSARCGVAKPDPAIFELTFQWLNVLPAELYLLTITWKIFRQPAGLGFVPSVSFRRIR